MTTGLRARRSTLDALGEVDPRFAEARAEWLANPDALFDPTVVLADLHALRRLAEERVQFWTDERGVEHAPALLDILTAIVGAQERGLRLREKAMHPQFISVHLVNILIQNTTQVMTEYIDPRDLSAALDKLRDLQAHCLDASARES